MIYQQAYCQVCDEPLLKGKFESAARYANKKTHKGSCSVTYAKTNKIGFYASNMAMFDLRYNHQVAEKIK